MDQLRQQTAPARTHTRRRSVQSTDRAGANAGNNAAAALQRALDRRDNGGVTGHMN